MLTGEVRDKLKRSALINTRALYTKVFQFRLISRSVLFYSAIDHNSTQLMKVTCNPPRKTSSPKGNDRSPDNKQVFLNSSQVSKRFFQLVKGS